MVDSELRRYFADIERDPSYNLYNKVANILDNTTAERLELPLLRIAILRNFTFEPLLAVLKSEIARIGFFPSLYLGDYDSVAQEAMNPDSDFYRFEPDVVILAQWLETLSPVLVTRFATLSSDDLTAELKRVLETIRGIVGSVRKYCKAPILLNNFPLPDYVSFGILDTQIKNWQINSIRHLNQELLRLREEFTDVYIVDYDYLMARVGYQHGFDERYWHIGKAPISRHALVPLGLEYARFLRALNGKVYKCLILDCDDTLWGGIVGEDGLEGIRLGPTYPGSCYMAFQREILNLHDRGVILSLCSKNNEEDVLEVLRNHPYCLLREEHFATWRINWDDKATNILRIVEELNIGMDSVVFVDDSEYEIGLVKSQIPEITVLKLASEPSRFRSEIIKKGYFDSLSFSQEDRKRNKMYKDEAKRRQISTQASSIEEYLNQLQIHICIKAPDAFLIPRVAQLTQKTNQFNLTTKRYTEGDIARFVEETEWDVWCLRLRDSISDMGIVGVGIVKYDELTAEIDSFLLSCRAIGRGAEDALFAHIVGQVQSKKLRTLRGKYVRTRKNTQVKDFYGRFGLHCIATKDGESDWESGLKKLVCKKPDWITVDTE